MFDDIAQARINQLNQMIVERDLTIAEMDSTIADLHIKLADRDETIAAMYGEALKARTDRTYEPLEIVPEAG